MADIHPNHRERSDRYLYLLLILIVALLLAVAYYYKIILNKCLPLLVQQMHKQLLSQRKKLEEKFMIILRSMESNFIRLRYKMYLIKSVLLLMLQRNVQQWIILVSKCILFWRGIKLNE